MEFRLFGIPVRVHWMFLLMAVLIGLNRLDGPNGTMQIVVWIGIVFFGVLAHELGHAVVCRVFRQEPQILLHGMGGLTFWQPRGTVGPWKKIAISLAGPGVGIVIGLASVVAMGLVQPAESSPVAIVFEDLIRVNLGWGILNLIPMLPLDGGNVMASVLDLATNGRGLKPARWISIVLAVGVGVLCLFGQVFFGAVLCAMFAYSNWQGLRADAAAPTLAPLRVRLDRARALLDRGDPDAAIREAEALHRDATTSDMKAAALQVVAWAEVTREDLEAAARAVERFPSDQIPDLALQGILLLGRDRPEEAMPPLRSAFERAPGKITGLLLLESYAASGKLESAVDLLAGPAGKVIGEEGFRRVSAAAFESGAFDDAARVGKVWFERSPLPEVGYNVACALTRAGKHTEAVSWLRRAIEAGFRDLSMLDTDADLAPLRDRPDFADLRAEVERRGPAPPAA